MRSEPLRRQLDSKTNSRRGDRHEKNSLINVDRCLCSSHDLYLFCKRSGAATGELSTRLPRSSDLRNQRWAGAMARVPGNRSKHLQVCRLHVPSRIYILRIVTGYLMCTVTSEY